MTNATQPTATTTAPHFRLTIESVAHTTRDETTGQAETVLTTDLIATNGETGERWVYIGNAPCSTQGEALELMARIFRWERVGDHRLDPTRRPEFWTAERVPTVDPTWPTEVVVTVSVKPGVVKVAGRRARKVDAGKVRRLAVCAAG